MNLERIALESRYINLEIKFLYIDIACRQEIINKIFVIPRIM